MTRVCGQERPAPRSCSFSFIGDADVSERADYRDERKAIRERVEQVVAEFGDEAGDSLQLANMVNSCDSANLSCFATGKVWAFPINDPRDGAPLRIGFDLHVDNNVAPDMYPDLIPRTIFFGRCDVSTREETGGSNGD